MCEYSDALKLPRPTHPPLGGQGLQIKSFLVGKRGKYRGKKRSCSNSAYKNPKIL